MRLAGVGGAAGALSGRQHPVGVDLALEAREERLTTAGRDLARVVLRVHGMGGEPRPQ